MLSSSFTCLCQLHYEITSFISSTKWGFCSSTVSFFPTEESRYVCAMYCYNTAQKWTTAFSFLESKIITEEDGPIFFFKNVQMFS